MVEAHVAFGRLFGPTAGHPLGPPEYPEAGEGEFYELAADARGAVLRKQFYPATGAATVADVWHTLGLFMRNQRMLFLVVQKPTTIPQN